MKTKNRFIERLKKVKKYKRDISISFLLSYNLRGSLNKKYFFNAGKSNVYKFTFIYYTKHL